MRPVAWSSSYLFRWPFGISIVTSNCTHVVWPTATPRDRRRSPFRGVGTITSSGSTVVTANYGRFRKRMAMGIIGALLVVIAVVVSLVAVVAGRDDASGGSAQTVAVPDAVLPQL